MAWLGRLDEAGRLGLHQAAEERAAERRRKKLFAEPEPEPQWVEINTAAVRVENNRQFGGPWLVRKLIRRLGLDEFFQRVLPHGRERVEWSASALILMIARLCEPSSELHTAE